MIDVSDPTRPEHAACYTGVGWVHDGHCVVYHGPDTDHVGKEICVTFNAAGGRYDGGGLGPGDVSILDVTDKRNILLLSRFTYPAVAYPHQGSLLEDHAILAFGDEHDEALSEDTLLEAEKYLIGDSWLEAQRMPALAAGRTRTLLYNISDLDCPLPIGEHYSAETAIGHNMYAAKGYLWQANYCAGLRVLTRAVAAPGDLREVRECA